MIKLRRQFGLSVVTLLVGLLLGACSLTKIDATPTVSLEQIQTQAVATYSVGLTQTAFAMPTNTPTQTPTASLTPTATQRTTITSSAPIATSSCYGLTGVRDVTVPDNTPMVAGQTFTKTWLVRNSGTCSWEPGFKLVYFSGDVMGGSPYVLDKTVATGAEVELSIAMTAPSGKSGSIRGDWQMTTASGVYFGEEQYVIIQVGVPTFTVTGTPPTPTSTYTSTPTFTVTP
jgi:hypothetical protein